MVEQEGTIAELKLHIAGLQGMFRLRQNHAEQGQEQSHAGQGEGGTPLGEGRKSAPPPHEMVGMQELRFKVREFIDYKTSMITD